MIKKLTTSLLILTSVCVLFEGCASVTPGSDPIVVNAERSISSSVDVFDSLFKIEAVNHALLKQNAPQVVAQVNMLRRNAPSWIESTRSLTAAYKQNRSAQNKASLQTALAVLGAGVIQAQTYLTQVGGH